MGTEVHNNNSGSSATGGGGGAGNATATMAGGEFVMMKDTVWKLSSRVLLLEGFIKQQFGKCEETSLATPTTTMSTLSPRV